MSQVSILMPVYNGEEFLKQAMNSVLVQSFPDWELLVVNDGSTDRSGEIIKWYAGQDSRIKLITNEHNLGLVASLNEAVAAAKGDLLARLDCDDWWSEPQKLFKQVEFLNLHQDFGLVGTWAALVEPSGKCLSYFKPPVDDAGIRKQILWHNCFIHSSILARKDIMLKAGGYKAGDRHAEDYALWLRMGRLAKFANLPVSMVKYRINPAGVTKTKNQEQISTAIKLISQFNNQYPNFWLGWLKWHLQKLFA